MDHVLLNEYRIKLLKLRRFMETGGYGAVIIHTRDQFAWLTGGGDNKVFRSAETGACVLLVTSAQVYLIAQTMDFARLCDEELQGFDIEKVSVRWCDPSPAETALKMAEGLKVAADIRMEGADERFWDILMLHYPLLDSEIKRFYTYGRKNDQMILDVAQRIRAGMTEHEIEAEIVYEYAKDNFDIKVMLVGSDDRISKYRHPNASYKKAEKLVLLHTASAKRGLNFAVTRFVSFADTLPEGFARRHEALSLMEAQAVSMCRPGVRMGEIVQQRRRILEQYGYPEEFYNHYPGMLSGYIAGSAKPVVENEEIIEGMAFAWFITLTGAKVEETCISTKNGGKIVTAAGIWPVKTFEWNGCQVAIPSVLMK